MFEEDLESLPTRDLLEQAAECRTVASRADARLLESAQIYADRFHPSVCEPRPTRRACDGRERAVVLGGEGCPEIAEFAIAEFAVVVGVSPGVGRDLLADALALRHRFPLTWARIQAGEATPWKARQIVRACMNLDHAAAEYVDRKVAAIVDSISPYRLEKIVRAARKHADPARAAAEAAEAADDRGVYIGRGDGHGNKTIYIKAPAGAVNRCNTTITDIAEALKKFGDTRPFQHRRADAIDILSDPAFTQELLAQARIQPQTDPPDPATSSTEPEPATNHEPSTPTMPNNPTAPNKPTAPNDAVVPKNRVVQDDSVVQDPVVPSGGMPNDAAPLDDVVVPGEAVLPVTESGGDGTHTSPLDLPLPGARRLPDLLEPADPLESAGPLEPAVPLEPSDSLERPGSLELVEPAGPPDDPWLEAAAPYDPDPPTDPYDRRTPPGPADPRTEPDQGSAMDPAALRALRVRLAQIKQDAYANPSYPAHPGNPNAQNGQPDPGTPAQPNRPRNPGAPAHPGNSRDPGAPAHPGSSHNPRSPHDLGSSSDPGSSAELECAVTPARQDDGTKGQVRPRRARAGQVRPGQTEVVVHLTDHTLATGCGVLRAETIGPLLAAQLTELVGYGPYTVKPVIDLNDAKSVDAYEIPTWIRERVKLMHPAELFPYGTRETTNAIDLDHIEPYDPHGPTGQTSTTNLAPLGRFGHRVKTHARGWSVRRIDNKTLEWTTPHGFIFHVDPTGTHRIDP
ncbi:uncharacterized protein DUF222 [Kribbella sp. VKM Ac-2569]|uniref:DUF222 domain-containing protein n=1 Tax=Kribbella sp. VKM Ac-2569 TaxID=2512220 RepID=UPI00102ABB05|nr:DUF222 domain-containing protein [Kribbella sp. VKM Ac-2569]RZT15177.1 uncharacterized protein DUF222 [Kribbella sp. VKM Ac-2569]